MTAPFRLMSYNQSWEQEFQQSRSMLLWATEGWLQDVQHFGSTCLSGGIAQPVIDMLAGMQDLAGLNQACNLVEGLNYIRVESPQWCEDELTAFLLKPRTGAPTHSVLLTRRGGAIWQRSLSIREWLTSHVTDWQRLQNLKRDHFTSGCDALARYSSAKSDFFRELEQQIAAAQDYDP